MSMRAALLTLALAAALPTASGAAFQDVLDTPARISALAQRSPLSALAHAGGRLVAAGQRGHVLWSDDGGDVWHQASVPVSSDLVALCFADAKQGWAAGHDGVILHTADGGHSWQRQFDGRKLGAQGAENPLLDIWFADANEGWAVGAFGLILHTADGGAHWETVAQDQSDNPKALHLYAVRGIAGQIYIAGEQGLLLRRNAKGRFEALPQPYTGTLFGIAGDASVLLIHGLRGNALRSVDEGRSWQPIATGLQVGLTASAKGEDGRWYLASQAGHVLVSDDGARTFLPIKLARPQPVSALTFSSSGLVIAGPRGVQAAVEARK